MNTFLVKLLILFELLSVASSATAYDFCVDGIYYTIRSEENKSVQVTFKSSWASENNVYVGDVVIPESVSYNGVDYSVVAIGGLAFCGSNNMTSLKLPNSIKWIDNKACYECSGITSVEIPASVTTIGANAFWNCKNLASITVPENSNINIGEAAFHGTA